MAGSVKTPKPATCHPDKPHLARGLCGACYRRQWNLENPGGAKRIRENRPPATCHPDRPRLSRGLCSTCYRQQWRIENPERNAELSRRDKQRAYRQDPKKHRERAQAYRYGLTVQQVAEMREAQGHACAACGAMGRLQVDHCHDTGKVRALLCPNCNSALGHAKDDVTRLLLLVAYLQKHH